MSTLSLFHSIHDLNKYAIAQVIPCVASVPIMEYFIQAKSFLTQAAICQKSEDHEREYMFLVEYMILVIKRIPLHPGIYDSYEEYAFNKEKCYQVRLQIEKLRDQLMIHYGEKKPVEVTTIAPKESPKKGMEDSFGELDVNERKEIEDQVRRGEETEKRSKRVVPLPGIDDFTSCNSESVRILEKSKRALYIYREIRGYKRKFRHGVVDFEKKIRIKEKQRELEKLKREKEAKEKIEKEKLELQQKQEEQERLLQEKIKLESNRVTDFLKETISSPAPKSEEIPHHEEPEAEGEPPKVDDQQIDEFFN
jgi:hypothetical protein